MGKFCFVICPIGKDGTDIRIHSDLTLEYIIKPAVEPEGYDVKRADEFSAPGMITHQIIGALQEADLVIADFSYNNPNVFYELAIRHVVNKPVIHMALEGQSLPFDLKDYRTIYFNTDLKSGREAVKKLIAQIKEIQKNQTNFDNPISSATRYNEIVNALDNQSKNLQDGKDYSTADLLSGLHIIISDLKTEMMEIKKVIGNLPDTNNVDIPNKNLLSISFTETESSQMQYFIKKSNELVIQKKDLMDRLAHMPNNDKKTISEREKILKKINEIEIELQYIDKKMAATRYG